MALSVFVMQRVRAEGAPVCGGVVARAGMTGGRVLL
jgi:hypothetical protein